MLLLWIRWMQIELNIIHIRHQEQAQGSELTKDESPTNLCMHKYSVENAWALH